ncbi:MAG TPA: sugar phosphate nucleotidyltransferase [Bryobacteraceae bacterium]|nr:sugar phosphate nucleotidyltransferase [Bryobacteraceae bacterium]
MKALILAGGLGTRLRPFTFAIPKPLLPIGDKPILHIILSQMRNAGIDEIVLATGYQAELIRAFCGDGSRFGVRISYVHEESPLGTAGPLALARSHFGRDETFLLMNGDVITQLDLRAFLEAGIGNGCELTVGYTKHVYQSPYGVLTIAGDLVKGIAEKPSQEYAISTGIYCVAATALDLIPDDAFFTMPDLVQSLLSAGRKVAAHYVKDCWTGIETVEHLDDVLKELNKLPVEAFAGKVS